MYFQEYHAPGLSAEVCNAWQEAADMFDKAGAKHSDKHYSSYHTT
jgi:hypothetical protein